MEILQTTTLEWLLFPPLGDLPHPGIESESLASADGFFPTELLEKFC